MGILEECRDFTSPTFHTPLFVFSMDQEDTGDLSYKGIYNVSLHTVDAPLPRDGLPQRIVYSSADFDEARLRGVLDNAALAIVPVAPSVWRGVIKNIPGSLDDAGFPLSSYKDESTRASVIGKSCIVVVSLSASSSSGLVLEGGPVLVLQGLRYRGNVGAILRTAVQANIFARVIIIDPIYCEGAKVSKCLVPPQEAQRVKRVAKEVV